MTMSSNHMNKYSLSLVSGGKMRLPRSGSTTYSNNKCSNNTNGYLSKDCRKYIVPFNNMLRVYSLETRQCIKTFKYLNNKSLQTIFDENKDLEIVHMDFITSDPLADGTIAQQDTLVLYTNQFHRIEIKYRGKLEYNESLKVEKLFGSTDDYKLIKVFENVLIVETAQFVQIVKYNKDSITDTVEVLKEFPLSTVAKYSWSNNEQFLCVITEVASSEDKKHNKSKIGKHQKRKNAHGQLKKITTINLNNTQECQDYTISNTSQSQSLNSTIISSVAINNEADQVAIGFASGVINLLTLSNNEPPSTKLMKWHIDSVLSLAFEYTGQYLISGGWEKVLSFWSLKNSNTQQFLPRLNGVIVNVSGLIIPGYHSNAQEGLISIMLQQCDNETMSDYQLMIINSSDLQSKLSCNGPFASFENNSQYTKPISAVNTNNFYMKSKHNANSPIPQKKADVTIKPFVVQPGAKNLLYFPHASGMCIYDLNKNEQFKYQNLSFNVTSSMGKVRYEHENIIEPKIQFLKFNLTGDWLLSYETQDQPQGLISSNDTQSVLKFWNYNQSSSEWVLQTKIMNPHGDSIPIVEIIPHPVKKNCMVSCDTQGGLKMWSIIDEKASRWGLVDMKLPNSNTKSTCVNICYSKDGSLLFQSFDDRLYIMDSVTFKKIGEQSFMQLDSKIQKMMLSNDDENLIICTMTSIICYNLLFGEFTTGYDIYSYLNNSSSMYKQGNMKKLMSVNTKNSNVAMVLNIDSGAKVLVFNESLTEIVGSFEHNEYICNINWNFDDTFVFVDAQSRIGVITANGLQSLNIDNLNSAEITPNGASTDNAANSHFIDDEFNKNLTFLSKKVSDLTAKTQGGVSDADIIAGEKTAKSLNPNTFISLFDNIENVQLETLFDSVFKILT